MQNWIKAHKLIVVVVLLAGLGGWFFWNRGRQVTYDEFTVTTSRVVDTLELSGQVRAQTSASLRFGAGGLVTYLGAQEGDTVKKWQTLASVDARGLQKVLEQKLNLYSIQRGTFDQTVDDNNNSVPDGELGLTLRRLLEKNQYQLENTVKDVEYQALALSLTRLTSPLAGYLTQSPITTAGVQVGATDTWIVVDPGSLYFSADLDETDLSRAVVGQKVIIRLDAYPDREIETSIDSISYSPKETTAGTTYEVKMTLSPADAHDFRLGLNGTSTLILAEKNGVITLPSRALSSVGGQPSVLVKSGSQYEPKVIETGIEYDGTVEIISGLSEGDHVYLKK